ncbi:trichohyalin-like isoform X3 [Acropora millepora]|uniref:trichohyalin-like isoform X3 n=1 Tax=Acropora millepora TaxID=45264 RepID=UPI0010FCDAB6|nr:trichohyalin-like isoform X3 [Acropora millepora]
MELSSPPKPTRITQCLIPNLMEEKLGQQREETFRPEDCFEQDGNESGAEAISLSALAGEVADAQKQQINDLSKKLEILEELKEKQRQEIEDLIYSKGIITKQLAMAKENLVKDKETYGRYQMKMEAHIKRVEIYESSCNRNTKNQRWGNKIVEEETISHVRDDESGHKQIQETQQLKERRKYLEEAITLTQSELQKEKEKHAQLKREADTLQKRSRVYLSRLKRDTKSTVIRQQSATTPE